MSSPNEPIKALFVLLVILLFVLLFAAAPVTTSWASSVLAPALVPHSTHTFPGSQFASLGPSEPPAALVPVRDETVLTRGSEIRRQLSNNETHHYQIHATAGQFWRVVVEQRNVDAKLDLYAPDGAKLVHMDSPNGRYGPESVSFLAPTTGSYRLEVAGEQSFVPAGDYHLRVSQPDSPTPQDLKRIEAEKLLAEAGTLRRNSDPEFKKKALIKYTAAKTLWSELQDPYWEATNGIAIAWVYEDLGDKKKAIDVLQQSPTLYQTMRHQAGIAQATYEIGYDYYLLKEKELAIKWYNLALPLASSLGNQYRIAVILNNIGTVYSDQEDKRKSLIYYEQGLTAYRAIEAKNDAGIALRNIAFVYDDLGDRATALAKYAEAVQLLLVAGNNFWLGRSLEEAGAIHKKQQELELALDKFTQALAAFEKANNISWMSHMHNLRGDLMNQLRRRDEALDSYRNALQLGERSGNRPEIDKARNAIDEMEELKSNSVADKDQRPMSIIAGQPVSAEFTGQEKHVYHLNVGTREFVEVSAQEQGGDIELAAFDAAGVRLAGFNLARRPDGRGIFHFIAAKAGTYRIDVWQADKAPPARYTLTVTIKQGITALDRTRLLAETKIDQCLDLRYQGTNPSRQQSLERCRESIPLWKQLHDKSSLGWTLNQISNILDDFGQTREALAGYFDALAVRRAAKDPFGTASSLINIGRVNQKLGNYQEGINYYQQAIEAYRMIPMPLTVADLYGRVANLYELLKDPANKQAMCTQAASLYHDLGKTKEEGRALVCAGEAARLLSHSEQAMALYEKASPLLEQSKDWLYRAKIYEGLAEMGITKGDDEAALNVFKQALEMALADEEEVEAAHILERLGDLYTLRNNPSEAVYCFRQSLRYWRTQGKTDDAERTLKKAAALAPPVSSVSATQDDRKRPQLSLQVGHSAAVFEVKYSPDGKLLASAGDDHTVRLWEVATARELRTLIGHTEAVTSLAFSPDGQLLASGSNDHTIKLWDIRTGEEIKTFTGHTVAVTSVAFSPDGRTLVSGSDGKRVRVWDVATGKEKFGFDAHNGTVFQVLFNPNGKLIASAGEDKSVRLWDASSGSPVGSFIGPDRMTCVAFSPDGQQIAAGSRDLKIHLWHIASGREVGTFSDHTGVVVSVNFSLDGKRILSGSKDRSIKLWDIEKATLLRTYISHSDYVWSVALSPDGKSFASSANDDTVKLWSIDDERPLLTLGGEQSEANAVAFSSDNRFLAYSMGARVMLWDLAAGNIIGSFAGHRDRVLTLAFSHDNKMLATGSEDHTVKLWNVDTRQNLITLTGHSMDVFGVAFSPDDERLVTVSDDKKIKVWRVSDGKEIKTWVGGKDALQAIAFSPDGRWIATGSKDGTFSIWNAATYGLVRASEEYQDSISGVIFSPDKKTLATADGDGIIRLWDIESGQELHRLTGQASMIGNIAFSPDGHLLASAGYEDKTIKLWNVETGREIRTLTGHSRDVFDIAFSPNDRVLVSTSLDGSARVWDPYTGQLLLTLAVTDAAGHWLSVTPDGLFDGSASAWSRILWRFNDDTFNYAPVEAYFNDFFYPGLVQEIFRGVRPKPPEGKDLAMRDRRRPAVTIAQVKADGDSAASKVSSVSERNRNVIIKVEVTENTNKPAEASQSAGGGAGDIRLFHNGSLVKLWRGDAFGKDSECVPAAMQPATNEGLPRKAICTTTVPIVAGENQFTAYGFNRDNLKSDDARPLEIRGEGSLARKGVLYVLAIGVNKYENKNSDLKFAVADVDEIDKELRAQQEKLGSYEHTEVISLTDEEATRANILLALQRFVDGQRVQLPSDPALREELEKIKDIQPEDALVIYFAGHGTAKGERFYLLPHDFIAGDEEQVKASSVSDVQLNELLEHVGAGKLLMVIDACQSGQALGGEKEGRGPMNSKGLAQLAYDKGMYILTAAQSYQAAKEVSRTQTGKQVEHGLLTFALLEGLTKAKKDNEGRITEREWMNYAVEQVPLMQIEELKKRSLEIKEHVVAADVGGSVQRDTKEQDVGSGQLRAVLAFTKGQAADSEKFNVQRPRVFYRRELEAQHLIIARP